MSSLTFMVVNKIFLLSEDEISLGYLYTRTTLQILARQEKILEIVQENTLKCSKLSFLGNKKSSLNQG